VVSVWIVDLEGAASPASACSADEILQASRFANPDSGARWLRARAALRSILGSETGAAPADLSFVSDKGGKPRVAGHPHVHFNLSHARTLAAIAVADRPVGVDLEEPRRLIAPERLARRLFEEEEFEAWRTSGDEAAVLQQWTRVEALLKATGTGIAGGTRGAVNRLGREGWSVRTFDVAPAVGAVACRGTDWPLLVGIHTDP
jgi:4'-phosphopantetheinyl transferase